MTVYRVHWYDHKGDPHRDDHDTEAAALEYADELGRTGQMRGAPVVYEIGGIEA